MSHVNWINGCGVMNENNNFFVHDVALQTEKPVHFLTFLGWFFFHRFLTKFLNIHYLGKVIREIKFTREMLKNQLQLCKIRFDKI
jgi:hypothetical protein